MTPPPARRAALVTLLLSACAGAPAPGRPRVRPPRLLAESRSPGGARVARAYAVGGGLGEEVRVFVGRAAEAIDPAADEPAFAARAAGVPRLRWAGASALHVRVRPDAAVRRRLDRRDGVFLSYSALPPPLAIEDVTVIDATGAPPRPHATVVVEDGRVLSVGPAGAAPLPPEARRVVGAGAFLVPGLWDMHAHLSLTSEPSLPLYVANGVTGVRDMGGDIDELDGWKLRVAAGAIVGPRVVRPGPLVDGPKPRAAFRDTVTTPDEARQAVRRLVERGADFVKVHNRVPREAYFALADEAKKVGLRFAGHLPRGVSAEEAAAAGQHSVEHTETLVEAAVFEPGSRAGTPEAGLAAYTPERSAALWARFKAAGTWFCPTLVEYRAFAHDGEPELMLDPRSAWLSGPARAYVERWSPPPPPAPPGDDPNAGRKAMFAHLERMVGEMARAGVGLLAGTDPPGRGVYPGFSLHDELGLLVEAGLTPMQALQAATRNPALFLGLEASAGTIEPGKDADLVLLDADPLAAIANTRRVRAVVADGTLFARSDLDRLLADVARSVASIPSPPSTTPAPRSPDASPAGPLDPERPAPAGPLDPARTAPAGPLDPARTAPAGPLDPERPAPAGSSATEHPAGAAEAGVP